MKLPRFKLFLLGTSLFLFSIFHYGLAYSENQWGELTKLADKYGTDKGSMTHSYTEVYEHYFFPLKNEARKIFEIGVAGGASMKMFKEYFPNAVIYGIDITDTSSMNTDSIKTYVADQSKREQLKGFIDTYKDNYDIILDDGGHAMEQQQISFGYLFKYVKPGGYYIIEDVHTSFYGADFGVEKDGSNTTLEMVNKFIKNGIIESKYLTPEEKKYLTDHIKYCNLISRNRGGSIACIFKKK